MVFREMRDSRCWAVAMVLGLVIGGRAAAQGVVYQADGSVNSGYTQATQSVVSPDPMPDPADVKSTSTGAFFTEIRPGILIQSGSPRVTWRVGYMFAGILSVTTDQSIAYTNQANLSLAAELTRFTTLTLLGSAAQGGSSFLLGQQAADAGQPQIRAPGNPSLITASVGETIAWEARKHTTLQQSLSAALSAPQDNFEARNSILTGALSLNQVVDPRDALGLELRASVSWLQELDMSLPAYKTTMNSVRARWNRDISQQWNAVASAGVNDASASAR